METIVKAKDQQAAEANKNASILLKELDLEKVTSVPVSGLGHTVAMLHLMPGRRQTHSEHCSVLLTVSGGEQEAGPGCQEREAQGEAQEEERGAEEETGGRRGAENQGGVL